MLLNPYLINNARKLHQFNSERYDFNTLVPQTIINDLSPALLIAPPKLQKEKEKELDIKLITFDNFDDSIEDDEEIIESEQNNINQTKEELLEPDQDKEEQGKEELLEPEQSKEEILEPEQDKEAVLAPEKDKEEILEPEQDKEEILEQEKEDNIQQGKEEILDNVDERYFFKDMEQNNDVEDQYFAGEIIKKQGGQLPNHEGGNNYQNFVNKNTGGSIIFDNLSEKPNQSGGEDIKNVTVSFF